MKAQGLRDQPDQPDASEMQARLVDQMQARLVDQMQARLVDLPKAQGVVGQLHA